MSEKEISILRQEGDYLVIADTQKGYEGTIHKSLLEVNELDIVDNKIYISKTLYQAWFKDAMEKVKDAMEKVFKEYCELFYSHIPLLIEKQKTILQTPRLYSIKAPLVFYEGMFIGSGGITLGEMLLL